MRIQYRQVYYLHMNKVMTAVFLHGSSAQVGN
ncbi:conserved hypothetical protein [Leuconostoc carnosum]|nr:hypothetical protein [Leuconostoc carnosum]SPO34256.1 conserved hypothetical protein [Leuconostoc carnosum]